MRLKAPLALSLAGLLGVSAMFARTGSSTPRRNATIDQARRVHSLEARWKQSLFKPGAPKNATVLLRTSAGTGSISGRVSGISADAAGTAYVEALPVFRGEKDSTTWPSTSGAAAVGPDSEYRIEGLLPGAYLVYAHADGYVPQYYNGAADMAEADTVHVIENTDVSGIDFSLERLVPGSGSISGEVLDAKNGASVLMATVYAYATDQPFHYGKTQTDEQGRFRIFDLKTDDYVVEVYADGYLHEIYNDASSFEDAERVAVTEPGETTGIRFLLDRGGTISGTVVDQEGHPVMGAWVQANTQVPWDSVYGKPEPIGSGSGFGYGYSDENGAYRITGLEKGEYLVSAQAWNGWITETQWYNGSVLPDQATPVSVEPGEEVSGIDFRFSFPQGVGSVSGTVLDEKGVPVPNASVQVYTDFSAATGFSFWAYGYTDVEGRYRVDNIPEGTYIVSCWAQVGWQYAFRYWPDSETQEGAQKVTVDGNTENDRTDFRLPISAGASLVEGTVRSTTGRLLTNAFVQVVSKTEIPDEPARTLWAYGNTDSSGHYRVEYLPAGTYTVQCTYWEGISMGQGWYNQADAESLATPLVLGDREKRSGVDFNLNVRPMYGTIAGTVTDASTGLPIPKAYVEIEPVSVSGFRDRCWWGWWKNTAFTDEKGRFSVEWMWEGKYRIAAYADGAFAYYPNAPVPDLSEPVTVTGGETATADFALRRRNEGPCVIRGMITSEFGYWRNWGVDDTMIGPAPGLPETKPGKAVRIQKVLDASPLEGAVVVAKPAVTVQTWPESERFYNTLSRSDGSYELKGLPEGEYYVMAFGSTYMPAYYKDTFDPAKAVLVRVGEAEPAEAIDIALPPMIFMYWNADTEGGGRKDFSGGNGASVRGMVTDSSGKPVAGAVVYLLNTEGQAMASVTTNAEGAYEIAGMSAGNYVIQASKLGYATTFNGIAPSLESADPLFVGNGTLEMNFSLKGSSGIQPNPTTPSRVSLYANYPNPFNPVTSIRFALPAAAAVRLTVFDLNGRELKTLWNGPASEGFHQVTWNATDASGNAVPSGMYLYRLETPKSVKSGKMIYLR